MSPIELFAFVVLPLIVLGLATAAYVQFNRQVDREQKRSGK